jgi:anti-sigma regulatory factor (Ser/Thr protein kinase)
MESTLRISAEVPNLVAVLRFVEATAAALQVNRDVIDDMLQAVDESVTNIIVHGYHEQAGDVEIGVSLEGDALVVRLCDQAPLFNPTLVPPPDLTLPLEKRRFGGLGIYLARQFVDSMTYRVTSEGGNELTLRKAGPLKDQPRAHGDEQP